MNKFKRIAFAVACIAALVCVGNAVVREQSTLLAPVSTIAPQVHTSTATGTAVDLVNFGAATIVVHTGAYTDGTHTIDLEDSPDNSNWTDVAADYMVGEELVFDSTLEQNSTYWLGYSGSARYLRVNSAVVGTTTGALYSATVIKGLPRVAPTQ